MSSEIAAAGDVMAGALAARAVEPRAGEAAHGHGHGLCLNCGTQLIGEHCHACGQAGHVHRTVGAIGHELLHGVFHFEGKIWRTLPMLAFRPGELTRRYVAGERARFVSPLALFLFTVFLMFATINAVGGELVNLEPDAKTQERIAAGVATNRAELEGDLRRIERERAAAAAAGRPTDALDKAAAETRDSIRGLGVASTMVDAKNAMDGKASKPDTGWRRLDEGILKAKKNPGLTLYKLQSSSYKYSWLLILLSTPFVALMFLWRRSFGLYDHAVFVTYSLAFMMLLVIILTLAGLLGVGGGLIGLAAVLIPPIHMYKQLRGAYTLRRFSAAWRMLALLVFAGVALTAYLLLILLHDLAA